MISLDEPVHGSLVMTREGFLIILKAETKKINLSDVFHFPLQFWIIAALAMIYYTTIQTGIYGSGCPDMSSPGDKFLF